MERIFLRRLGSIYGLTSAFGASLHSHARWASPTKLANTDTGGEFIFAVLTKLTTRVFKHLLKVN
jgi:hypothetical protein